MLDVLGYASLDALTDSVVPASIRGTSVLPAGDGLGEAEALAQLRGIAEQNKVLRSFIGLGYYDTHHAAGDPAQRPREPRLVHAVHAVPGGDLAGPPRGAAQLPDDGRATSPACRSPTPRCSTKAPPPPRR